jgi:predicted RNase H-like HicB family nuclease
LQQVLNLGGIQIFVGQGATPELARAAGQAAVEEMLEALLRERQRLGLVN